MQIYAYLLQKGLFSQKDGLLFIFVLTSVAIQDEGKPAVIAMEGAKLIVSMSSW